MASLIRWYIWFKWQKDIALDSFGYYRRRVTSRLKGLIDPKLDFWPFNEDPGELRPFTKGEQDHEED